METGTDPILSLSLSLEVIESQRVFPSLNNMKLIKDVFLFFLRKRTGLQRLEKEDCTYIMESVLYKIDNLKVFLCLQIPAYISAQLLGSLLASGTLRLLFTGPHDQFAGTHPVGSTSDIQAFVIEFIITFYLMFVISGVATDNRAVRFRN